MSNTILDAIGHTPLVKLQHLGPPTGATVWVKLEYFNPTSSYKDRMALSIIEEAEKRGDLKPGKQVIECTGGSTGTSMAFVCTAKGYPFTAISSDAFAKEKLRAIQLFGGQLELVASEGGKITPDLIPRMIALAEKMSAETGAYWTRQFTNKDALLGYQTMGMEIIEQINQPVAVFCAAVGTAGMAMGVAQGLRKKQPGIHVVLLEPASAPLLTTGTKGSHKVEGIGVGMIPPLLDKEYYDEVIAVDEADARRTAMALAEKEGILAGTSTGMNVAAAINLAKSLKPDQHVVTVACDSGLKYFAGGLFD